MHAPTAATPLDSSADWRTTLRIPIIALIAALAVFAWNGWREYRFALDSAFAVMDVRSELAVVTLEASFTEINTRLQETSDVWASQSALDASALADDLSNHLSNQMSRMPGVVALAIVGADERILSAYAPTPTDWNETLIANVKSRAREVGLRRENANPIHISNTLGSALEKRVVVVSRPLRDRSGTVKGVVAAALELETLATRIAGAQSEASGALVLVSEAGTVLLRLPDPRGEFTGKSLLETDTYSAHRAAGTASSHHRIEDSPFDHKDRLVVYRDSLAGLSVAISVETEHALAAWRAHIKYIVLIMLAFLALLLVFARLSQRQGQATYLATSRFAAVVNHSQDTIAIMDRSGILRYISPSAERISGFPAESAVGADFHNLVHPDDRARLDDAWSRLINNPGVTERLRYRTRQRNNDWQVVETFATAHFDTPGIHGVLLMIRDIGDQMRIEESLRRSEEMLKKAQALVHIGSWVVELPSHALTWSDEIYRIFGLEPGSQIEPDTFSRHIHADDRNRVNAHWQSLLAGEAYDILHRIVVNGEIRWVHEVADLVHDADGVATCITGTTQDVTVQHLAATQVTELLEFNEHIIAASTVGIAVYRAEGPCVLANEAMASILGGTLESVRAHDFRRLTTWRVVGLLDDAMETLQTNRPVRRVIHGESSFGKPLSIDCELVAITRQGEPHLLVLVKDVSEYRATEQALRQATQLAKDASQAKSIFLANVSHEIRTPMNAIIGLSQLSLDRAADPTLRDYLQLMYSSANALLSIINDILDYSKMDAGRLTLEEGEFAIRDIADNLQALFRVAAARKGLDLDVDIEPTLPLRLMGDSMRLGQVLTNLVGNAIKFTEQGRVRVHISMLTALTPGTVRLRFAVHDTGIGIAEDALSRLFQPFVQADGSITRRYGGTGLGLAISRRLVLLMGSDIVIESELGSGSQFYFDVDMRLPERVLQADGTPPASEASPETRTFAMTSSADLLQLARPIAGASLLLVEDDAINQRVMRQLLQNLGLRITVAEHGKEALEWLEKTHFDAVLMDMHLPVMDGIQTSLHIRADPRWAKLPIIAITAALLRYDRSSCMEAGINDYITKPGKPQEIINALLRHLPHTVSPVTEHPDTNEAEPEAAASDLPRLRSALQSMQKRLRNNDFVSIADQADLRQLLRSHAGMAGENASLLGAAISRYDYTTASALISDLLTQIDMAIATHSGRLPT